MNNRQLIIANFRGRLKSNLAVAIAVAIACSTIIGSLMVGDSIRYSLREMALARLGKVTHVIRSQNFVGDDLAERIATAHNNSSNSASDSKLAGPSFIPAILSEAAIADGSNSRRCNRANVYAAKSVEVDAGSCIINRQLADILSTSSGDEIVLRIARNRGVDQNSPLTGLKRSERLAGLRLTVQSVDDEKGFVSRFELYPTQQSRPIAWLNIRDLQRSIDAEDRINAVLIEGDIESVALGKTLKNALKPSDFALKLQQIGESVAISSSAIHLPPAVEDAFDASTPQRRHRILTGLLSSAACGDIEDHYGLAAGMDSPPGGPLADNEVAINTWLANRLGIVAGNNAVLDLRYFARQQDGSIGVRQYSLTVARIVAMEGAGVDSSLAPDYPGISDADSPTDWSAPGGLDIDMSLVDEAEEQYWQDYRAAPRVFVNYETAARLWGKGQNATSIRISGTRVVDKSTFVFGVGESVICKDGEAGNARALSMQPDAADGVRSQPKTEKTFANRSNTMKFATDTLATIAPAALSVEVIAVRDMQLAAARGSSDFATLLLSLSGLIWLAAALLAALIIALTMKSYRRQADIMLRIGHDIGRIMGFLTTEILMACLLGLAIGIPGGTLFCSAMIKALSSIWIGATGTSELSTFVNPATIASGAAALALVLLIAVTLTIHLRIRPIAIAAYKKSAHTIRHSGKPSRIRKIAFIICYFLMPPVLIAVALSATQWIASQPVIFGSILGVWVLCLTIVKPSRGSQLKDLAAGLATPPALRILRLAGSTHRGRLVLVAAMTALAIYGLALTALFGGQQVSSPDLDRLLIVDLTTPLPVLPDNIKNRRLLGMGGQYEKLWSASRCSGVKIHRNEDISCNNMTRPMRASIASVDIESPESIAVLTEFGILGPLSKSLGQVSPHGENRPPAAADSAAAQYILQVKKGDSLPVTNSAGDSVILHLAGTLLTESFAGELIVKDSVFRDMFPSRSGFDRLLISAADTDPKLLASGISAALADYGAQVATLAQLRAKRSELRGAYLAAFRSLGVIAAILGIFGLTISLYRNLLDSRRQLAMMWAMGFSTRLLSLWSCGQSVLAVIFGLIAAFAALTPALISSYVNIAQVAPVTAVMTILSLAAILTQFMLTYRFISKLELRDLACE